MSAIYAAERQYLIDRHEADAYAAGLSEIWSHLIAQDDTASRSILLGIVGALATYLRETGYTLAASP